MSILSDLAPVAIAVATSGVVGVVLDHRSKARVQSTRESAVAAREITKRHRIADGTEVREDRVLERLHDDCRREVAASLEKIEALFEVNGTTQVELTKVVGQLARCEEQHEEQHSVNGELRRESAGLAERLSRLERRSNPPAMEPAE